MYLKNCFGLDERIIELDVFVSVRQKYPETYIIQVLQSDPAKTRIEKRTAEMVGRQ